MKINLLNYLPNVRLQINHHSSRSLTCLYNDVNEFGWNKNPYWVNTTTLNIMKSDSSCRKPFQIWKELLQQVVTRFFYYRSSFPLNLLQTTGIKVDEKYYSDWEERKKKLQKNREMKCCNHSTTSSTIWTWDSNYRNN